MRSLLIGSLVLTAVVPKALPPQEASDRGALVLVTGKDTIVVDRFIRTADALEGSIVVKGQPRIDYLATLAPSDRVRSLLLATYAPGAAADAAPTQRIRMTVQGDT